MKITVKHIIIFILLLTSYKSAWAQNAYYNLNIDNGLPSNHVYSTITDHLGYLWIATDNGVVKYNGYDFKVFTTQDGLPKNDVWQLLEDKKGRIWLGCIADRFGYIYNDKYYDAKIAAPVHSTIYPVYLSSFGDHIMFVSSYMANTYHPSLCIEKNDTIYSINVAEKLQKLEPTIKITDHGNFTIINIIISNNTSPKVIYNGHIYEITVIRTDSIQFKRINWNELNLNKSLSGSLFGNKLVYTVRHNKKHVLKTFDYQRNIYDSLDITNTTGPSKIPYLSYNASDTTNSIFLFNEKKIFNVKLNPSISIYSSVVLDPPINKLNINTAYEVERWGLSIATPTAGLFIKRTQKDAFKKYRDLIGLKYVGGDYNEGFWVDPNYRYLLRITDKIEKITTPATHKITLVKRKSKNEWIIFGQKNWLLSNNKWTPYDDSLFCLSILDAHARSYDDWYCVSNFSFYHIDPIHGKNEKAIDIARYNNLIYDSLRDRYFVYNQNSLLIYYPKNRNKEKFTEGILKKKFGITAIESICLDNQYGNIFINGGGNLLVYDEEKNCYVHLRENINLTNSRISVYKNILIIYGRFGIQFRKILGKNKLSRPITYYNFKTDAYTSVESAQFVSDKVILNTNKATYITPIPLFEAELCDSSTIPFQLVYYYKNSISKLNNGDTLKVDPEAPVLRFDNINLLGDGKVTYSIQTDDSMLVLNGTEFTIPNKILDPDHYHRLCISAGDMSWNSSPITFTIYIVPKWYQTRTMVKFIWIISGLAFILIISIAILITRRLVLNASKKRNLRMELELKSIYAQINPHFIFNSLNSALLLVSKNKTEEAYSHISKFSKLLRSYIKSSRNKLILLSDEIKNLTNYIDLQQVRFKDKFSYSIDVEQGVEANDIYIPSLLLQPFVENAIEHGLLSKEMSGHLSVKFHRKGNKLLCIIEDDGIGRKESKLNKTPNPVKDESYGELLIKDLVNIFNKYEHMNIHIEYEDKVAPLSGTVVTIYINIEKQLNDL